MSRFPEAHKPPFDGSTYDHDRDHGRLSKQIDRVWAVMSDGRPRTLREIRLDILTRFGNDDPEASISARLRDLRKEKFGGYAIDRAYIGAGLYVYTVLNP